MSLNQFGKTRHWVSVVLSLTVVLALLAAASPYLLGCREGCYSRPNLVATAKHALRVLRVGTKGEKTFVDNELAHQVATTAGSSVASRTTLETALLPLDVKRSALSDSMPYPAGAGGLAVVDGQLLVLDRLGQIYLYKDGKIAPVATPVRNGVREYIAKSSNLTLNADTLRTHSIAFDPAGQRLYACYEKYLSPSQNRFEIASIAFDPAAMKSRGEWRIEYASEPIPSERWGIAGGGKLLVDGRNLYFSVGDYGFYGRPGHAQEHAAQDPKRPFGKIFVMNLADHSVHNISIGHRNTQGLVMSADGKLFNVEQGPQGGDEINLIEPGKNYGWPIETYGTDYGAYTWPLTQLAGALKLQPPVFAFVPSVATSSIVQLKGWHPRWDGDFLVGSLKAQSLLRIRMVDDHVVFSEPIWIGHRVRDIAQIGPVIYLLTDDGMVMELRVDAELLKRNVRAVDAVPGRALSKCLGCHHFGETNPTHLAPTLSNLIGRKVAADNFTRYSAALKAVGGTWTRERLAKFLENPADFAPGTAMPKVDLTRSEIDEIVGELAGK